MSHEVSELRFKRSQLRAKVDSIVRIREDLALELDEVIRQLDQINLQLAGSAVERTPRKVELPPARRMPLEMSIQ